MGAHGRSRTRDAELLGATFGSLSSPSASGRGCSASATQRWSTRWAWCRWAASWPSPTRESESSRLRGHARASTSVSNAPLRLATRMSPLVELSISLSQVKKADVLWQRLQRQRGKLMLPRGHKLRRKAHARGTAISSVGVSE